MGPFVVVTDGAASEKFVTETTGDLANALVNVTQVVAETRRAHKQLPALVAHSVAILGHTAWV